MIINMLAKILCTSQFVKIYICKKNKNILKIQRKCRSIEIESSFSIWGGGGGGGGYGNYKRVFRKYYSTYFSQLHST